MVAAVCMHNKRSCTEMMNEMEPPDWSLREDGEKGIKKLHNLREIEHIHRKGYQSRRLMLRSMTQKCVNGCKPVLNEASDNEKNQHCCGENAHTDVMDEANGTVPSRFLSLMHNDTCDQEQCST
mmetsp:Transcript_11566/g.17265  ORF Transcript_11566/g.17265 Transcript_11566/m.17265 type:complete len:124 (-) Transcript_11566:540-911(-)